MRTYSLLVILLFILHLQTVKGQELSGPANTSKWDVGLEGMLGVSFGKDFYAVNVGGPGLFLVLNEDFKIGVGALPSLYSHEGRLGARLGVSPRIDYKNMVFIAPFFHKENRNLWISSIGFGYKFHRKKQL
jgi:hypothetical protein